MALPPNFLMKMVNVHGKSTEEGDVDGEPMDDEEVDGEPMDEEDIDGEPMVDSDEDAATSKEPKEAAGQMRSESKDIPSSEADREGLTEAARARRQRPRAVDMFADSDEE